MTTSVVARSTVGFGWTVLLVMPAVSLTIAQQRSPVEGPWSGEARCVLVTKDKDYEEQRTHTWRLMGSAPPSGGTFQNWPGTWSVQGSGRRVLTGGSESWTIKSDMNAPLTISDVIGGRIRIGSRHGLLDAPLGSISITPSTGPKLSASAVEWPFPVIEDVAANTTISGTSTRTLPEGVTVGWRQPSKLVTRETCTWNFVRGDAVSTTQTAPTGRQAAGDFARPGSITVPIPLPPAETAAATAPLGPAPATAERTVRLTPPTGGHLSELWSSGSNQAVMVVSLQRATVQPDGSVWAEVISLGNVVPGHYGTSLTLQCPANRSFSIVLKVVANTVQTLKTWTEPASQKRVFTFEQTVDFTATRSGLMWEVQGSVCSFSDLAISGPA